MSEFSSDPLRTPSPLLRSLPRFEIEQQILHEAVPNASNTSEAEAEEGAGVEAPVGNAHNGEGHEGTVVAASDEADDWSEDEVFDPEGSGDEGRDASEVRRRRLVRCFEFESRKLLRVYRRTMVWYSQIFDDEAEFESYGDELEQEYVRFFDRLMEVYRFESQMLDYEDILEAEASVSCKSL